MISEAARDAPKSRSEIWRDKTLIVSQRSAGRNGTSVKIEETESSDKVASGSGSMPVSTGAKGGFFGVKFARKSRHTANGFRHTANGFRLTSSLGSKSEILLGKFFHSQSPHSEDKCPSSIAFLMMISASISIPFTTAPPTP